MKLKLNLNPNLGNQEVLLSDKTKGQLSVIRIPNGMINTVTQWTFVPVNGVHDSFIFTGDFVEGKIINSLNNQDQYVVHFLK